LGGRRA